MNLFERVNYLAKLNGTTVKALERDLGIGNGTIARWDKSSPSVAKAQLVADYFGVSVDYLINGNEKEPAPSGNELDTRILRLFNSLPASEQSQVLGYLQALKDTHK